MTNKDGISPGPRPAWRLVMVWGGLIAAFSLMLALRLRQSHASLAFDEYASLYFADHSFRELWGSWLVRETNPPLFYSLLKLWQFLVPASSEALRFLPLLLSVAQIGLVSRWAAKTYGLPAALACILLYAVSPADIYQSEYLRGYVLAKLGVTVSFIGLVTALDRRQMTLLAWAAYFLGAAVAIYSHTTMILWPVTATGAVIGEWVWRREIGLTELRRLIVANAVIVALSGWEIWTVILQTSSAVSNLGWIEPLSFEDLWSTLKLQVFLGGTLSSVMMATLVLIGLIRSHRELTTRMSMMILALGLILFKAADLVQPIMTDFTLHWAGVFTVLLAGAALADPDGRWVSRRAIAGQLATLTLLVVAAADALANLGDEGLIPEPQDWRVVVTSVAQTPHSALLVSHESIGIVVKEACRLQFHRSACPFPLVVLKNPALSDSWARGGYGGKIVPPAAVAQALKPARTVFVFSRYVYTPLAQIGLDEAGFSKTAWDDGELIGPIPIVAFSRATTSSHHAS